MECDISVLRCPRCAMRGGVLVKESDVLLKCADCGHEYMILNGLPVMLTEEGDFYQFCKNNKN